MGMQAIGSKWKGTRLIVGTFALSLPGGAELPHKATLRLLVRLPVSMVRPALEQRGLVSFVLWCRFLPRLTGPSPTL